MKTIIAEYKIGSVWHFTDESNLASIKRHGGLWSLVELQSRGIVPLKPGGNDWSHDADRRVGMDKYVHLTFVTDHPMLFKAKDDGTIPNPYWLEINTSIMLEAGVLYCKEVANKSGAEILDAERAKEQIDFEILFKPADWSDLKINARRQAAYKSEILVPSFVPMDMILNFPNG